MKSSLSGRGIGREHIRTVPSFPRGSLSVLRTPSLSSLPGANREVHHLRRRDVAHTHLGGLVARDDLVEVLVVERGTERMLVAGVPLRDSAWRTHAVEAVPSWQRTVRSARQKFLILGAQRVLSCILSQARGCVGPQLSPSCR